MLVDDLTCGDNENYTLLISQKKANKILANEGFTLHKQHVNYPFCENTSLAHETDDCLTSFAKELYKKICKEYIRKFHKI